MLGDVAIVVLVVWLLTETLLSLGREIRTSIRKRG